MQRLPLTPRRSAVPARSRCLLLCLALLASLWGGALTSQPAAAASSPSRPVWQTLDGCALVASAYHDGDSFHVRHQGRDWVFRLYFVDAPETDAGFPQRVADQQAAFHELPKEAVLLLGAEARHLTETLLGAKPFRVVTAFEKAPGQSATQRFYALVFVGRKNLALELVRRGLARVHGKPAAWPDAAGGERLRNQLRAAADQAMRDQVGAWRPGLRKRSTEKASRLDLNRASEAEIARLPGIGEKLAQRIVAARPFRTLSDLDAVPGIGPARLQALEPLVEIRSGR